MIDVENQVYTAVASALRSEFPGITVDSVTTFSPSKFPYVCIEETDSYALRSSQDTTSNENHAVLVYEVNVFSNKQTGKKSKCKEILSYIDDVLSRMGFTRTARMPINSDDASKFRYFARYTAIVGDNQTIYRR